MRIILHIVLYIFIFLGCTPVVKNSVETPIVKNIQLPTAQKSIDKKIVKEVQVLDENKTIEPTIVSNEEIINEITNETIKIDNKRIAVIFSSATIGKYALEATNTINTYLLYKNKQVQLRVFDMIVQNQQNIINVFDKIKDQNITKVVAMITKDDLSTVNNIENINNIQIYLPLINKNEIDNIDDISNLNLLFGAIDYKKQFDKLIEYCNNQSLVELYDNTAIGNTLHSYLDKNRIKYIRQVDDNNGNYKNFLKHNKKLTNSVVILNTPIVKSSILLSAITAEELQISKIVSTQLNYTPLLFSLTQKQDRVKLIVANSIGNLPDDLQEYNQLIGNNILYSWVNYSSIIGIEYLINGNIDIFEDLKLDDNQVIYNVKLYKVGDNSFQLID